MNTLYNADSKESIIEFSKLLIGKSVSLEFKEEITKLGLSSKDKGQLGKVIEELYFKYKPNSSSEADFKSAVDFPQYHRQISMSELLLFKLNRA